MLTAVGLLSAVGVSAEDVQQEPQLAFPGAVGFGRFATGGRGGTVYHVTNLNDNGTGSLRDALSQPNRIIVFDVSGVIKITSRLTCAKNITIAGQTAPGEGIIVYGNGISFTKADNMICRYVRFREGKGGDNDSDCATIADGGPMIFDHCSFSWGKDETFSISGGGQNPNHITISNSTIGLGLMVHSAGGLIQADSITLYRNLYCDNLTRNNKVKGRSQYVNNIVYNWSDGAYIMGDSEGDSFVEVTNNLFINGPENANAAAFTRGNANFRMYIDDNLQDKGCDGELNPTEVARNQYQGGPTFVEEPFAKYPTLEKWSAIELPEKMLPGVGASLPYRDPVDAYMVWQVGTFGLEGAFISDEAQLPFGIPTTWTHQTFEKPADTDGDGMPDAWETANGTNPSADDAMVIAANGYANIENYINSISEETVGVALREPMMASQTASDLESVTLGWFDFTRGEEAFVVEIEDGEEWKEAARTEADATSVTIEGLETASKYNVRIYAVKGEKKSEYATLLAKTASVEVEKIDCETFEATEEDWLIETNEGDRTETLSEDVEKRYIVVRGEGTTTIDGEKQIEKAEQVVKGGTGKLVMTGDHSYKGASVLNGGTWEFSTLKNAGEPSSIGASADYPQMWGWNGGTWVYTGDATETDKSAKMTETTTFVVDKNVTVGMNGSIEGAGDLVIDGKGTIAPKDSTFFRYRGKTVLRGGTLHLKYLGNQLETNVRLSRDENGEPIQLVMAGGRLTSADAKEHYTAYLFPIEVVEGTTSVFEPNAWCEIKSKVTGSGTLEFRIPYVRERVYGDWTGFTGTLIAKAANKVDGKGCLLYLDNGHEMPNAVIKMEGQVHAACWTENQTFHIGGLSGGTQATLGASGKNSKSSPKMMWYVGGKGTDEVFDGIINNAQAASREGVTSIVKEGDGKWTLNGANTYAGTTEVTGGTLVVNGTQTGTGAITVRGGATLAGKGTMPGAMTSEEGATIIGGNQKADGTKLTLGSVDMNGGTIELSVSGTKCNRLTSSSSIKLRGTKIKMNIEEGTTFADGKKLVVLSGSSIDAENVTVEPERPSETQEWDLSNLSKGWLKVVGEAPTTGVKNLKAESETDATYDMTGRKVGKAYRGIAVERGKIVIKK